MLREAKARLRSLILKQYNIGGWYGGARQAYGKAMGYQGATNAVLLSVTAYNTLLLRPEMAKFTEWLTFPMFMAFLACVLTVSMLFAYKVDIPSSYVFGNEQSYKHNNLIREQLDREHEYNRALFTLLLKELAKLKEKKDAGN